VTRAVTTTKSRNVAKFALMAVLYREQVGERIRQLRDERSWTQEELGDLIGVRANTISRWERGRHLGSGEHLEKIAAAFELTVAEFMGHLAPNNDRPRSSPSDLRAQLDRMEAEIIRIREMLTELLARGARLKVESAVNEVEKKAREDRQPRQGRDAAGGRRRASSSR
jgi:putative transcriptional regulator